MTPFAIRIGIADMEKAGSTAGRIFALSTAGSLIGTFLPAIVTIPLIGTQRTLIGAAAVIAAAACLLLGWRWVFVPVILAALLAIPPGAVKATAGLIYEKESRYQFVQVVQREDDTRLLYLNEGFAVHSIWRPNTVLTGGEWDMFLTVPPLMDRPVKRIAILGNAGGTTARSFGVYYPDIAIDGVEIDPEVNAVAKKYFGETDNVRLNVVTADARPFLQAATEKYDLIFIDAYRQPYVPFYLATADFFKLCRDHLAPDGIVALNVSTVPGDDRLSQAVSGTLATQFPLVMKWPALHFNQLVLGFAQDTDRAVLAERAAQAPAGHPAAHRSPVQGVDAGGPHEGLLDRRPMPRGMDHRPDDHHVRGQRQRPRRTAAAHRPVSDGSRATRRCGPDRRPSQGPRRRRFRPPGGAGLRGWRACPDPCRPARQRERSPRVSWPNTARA